jgi:hypothetical protein
MRVARRGFLRTVAAAPLLPAPLAAQGASASATLAGNEGIADALAEAVKRQFGAHLAAAELEAVKKELARGLERGARLHRAARLGNADGPVCLFEARPPQGRGGAR